MKKNNYFIYSNIDELYGFLVSNMIYPNNNQDSALSLSINGYIYLTKKRFPRNLIYSKCQRGVMGPVVIEVAVKAPRDKDAVVLSEDELLITVPVSFNSVVSIYYLDGEFPLSLFNDAYLFRSLLSERGFEYGDDLPSDFCVYQVEEKKNTYSKWDKLQGFYAARYAAMRSEFKAGKNLVLASNLDEESALELLGQSQKDFFADVFSSSKKYFFREDYRETSDCAKFINNNYSLLLSGKKMKGKYENKATIERMFEACKAYKKEDNLSYLIGPSFAEKINALEEESAGDFYYLKELLFFKESGIIRLAFLLNAIVSKEYEEALDFLSNFEMLSDLEKKCLLGMYGLCVGMSRLTISIKRRRPDLLLFSFNKTKKHFEEYIDSGISAKDYFKSRDFVVDYLTKDGFNYVAYNREFELNYLRIMCSNHLITSFDIPKRMIGKDIIKFSTAEELHRAFLLAKRRNG